MACPDGQYFCNEKQKCMPIPKGSKVRKDGELVSEVAPPGFGHTKGDKKKGIKKGGTAAAFDRARKEGRFKGSKSDMFAIMWAQKKKGAKPQYKPGTDKKYKKYQEESLSVKDSKKLNKAAVLSYSDDPKDQHRARVRQAEIDFKDLMRQRAKKKKSVKESFEIDTSAHKKAQKKAKLRNLAKGNTNPNEKAAAEKKAGGPKLIGERLGGKGYKPYTSLMGKKVSGDWEDSDRGAGNKAKKRAGGKVEKKSPTYQAYVLNKESVRPKLAFEGWQDRARDAMKRVVKKKDAPKHDYGRDAGAEAKRRLAKKDHETVNFLDPED